MNDVKVGVREWSHTQPADEDHERNASLRVYWVEVDGVRVPGTIMSVDWHGDGSNAHEVTIHLLCGKFETVDA